jgi:Ca2+-binding RTX toxin-like protein
VTLSGTNNSDLIGNAYDNVLTGNAGENVLTGGRGNDTIDGGEGKDTAVFSGPRSDYIIRIHNGDSKVTDKITDRDGEDSLKNIEILKFSDEKVEI